MKTPSTKKVAPAGIKKATKMEDVKQEVGGKFKTFLNKLCGKK